MDQATGKTVFPPFAIKTFEGIKVGFIGLSLKSTPEMVVPDGTAGLTFADEAQTINGLVPVLRGQGVEAIVVLIHEGGYPVSYNGDCPGISGAITEIVPKLDKAVDLVVSGHTHRAYICRIDGRLVTSAGLYGMMLSDIAVTLDRATRDVTATAATNLIVTPDIPEDADAAALGALRPTFQPRVTETMDAIVAFIGDLVKEGAIGAVLTGLMVLLFLCDWRSAFIVVLNIPIALLAATFAVYALAQRYSQPVEATR